VKNDQNMAKLGKNDREWMKNDQNMAKLGKNDRKWVKMTKIWPNWVKMTENG
jgi:hypothetical protein